MTGVAFDPTLRSLSQAISDAGFAFAPAQLFGRLLSADAQGEWSSFAASWNDLGVDTYMADGGRYR